MSEPLEGILFEGQQLHIKNSENFIAAILFDKITSAGMNAFELFTQDFATTFTSELNSFDGDISAFDEADKIVKKYYA